MAPTRSQSNRLRPRNATYDLRTSLKKKTYLCNSKDFQHARENVLCTNAPCIGWSDKMIIAVVGKEAKTFPVYKDAFVESSALAKAALGPSWTQAGLEKIELTDVKTESFEAYLSWLYNRKDPVKLVASGGEGYGEDVCRLWVDMYLMGEYIQDGSLQDAVIDKLIDGLRRQKKWPVAYVDEVYEGTPAPNKLRQLLVDIEAHLAGPKNANGKPGGIKSAIAGTENIDFCKDVLEATKKKTKTHPGHLPAKKWEPVTCHYHVHALLKVGEKCHAAVT